jgi:hypothetical protein
MHSWQDYGAAGLGKGISMGLLITYEKDLL